jgi:hypothetical protein
MLAMPPWSCAGSTAAQVSTVSERAGGLRSRCATAGASGVVGMQGAYWGSVVLHEQSKAQAHHLAPMDNSYIIFLDNVRLITPSPAWSPRSMASTVDRLPVSTDKMGKRSRRVAGRRQK